jgi:hypothetical protein
MDGGVLGWSTGFSSTVVGLTALVSVPCTASSYWLSVCSESWSLFNGAVFCGPCTTMSPIVLVWGLGVFGLLNKDTSQYLSNLEDIYIIFCIYYQYLPRCTLSSDIRTSHPPHIGHYTQCGQGTQHNCCTQLAWSWGFLTDSFFTPWDGTRVLLSKVVNYMQFLYCAFMGYTR